MRKTEVTILAQRGVLAALGRLCGCSDMHWFFHLAGEEDMVVAFDLGLGVLVHVIKERIHIANTLGVP
jgi:hypothetical protein